MAEFGVRSGIDRGRRGTTPAFARGQALGEAEGEAAQLVH